MVQFETEAQTLRDSALGASKAGEAEDVEVMDFSTEASGSDSSESSSSPTQVAARRQIQQTLQRLEERRPAVRQLLTSVQSVAREGDVEALKGAEQLLAAARKQARNLGEDLLEDLLALDKLAGLSIEDRTSRKKAIADIEGLLEDVDRSKKQLAGLEQEIRTHLEAAESLRGGDSEMKDVSSEAEAKLDVQFDNAKDAMPAPRPQLSKHSPGARKGSPRTIKSRCSPRAPLSGSQPAAQQGLPAPDSAMWDALRLDVGFTPRQDQGGYTILAALPGLSTENLKIELSDDQSSLRVAGLCLPTARQAEQMQQQVAFQLQRLAQTSPQRFQQVKTRLQDVVARAYMDLGEGKFGQFSESFRMPADVDIQRIRAALDDGVLRITLPRRGRAAHRPMTARQPQSTGFWGHSAFGF